MSRKERRFGKYDLDKPLDRAALELRLAKAAQEEKRVTDAAFWMAKASIEILNALNVRHPELNIRLRGLARIKASNFGT